MDSNAGLSSKPQGNSEHDATPEQISGEANGPGQAATSSVLSEQYPSTNASSQQKTGPTLFHRLPAELRNRIYEDCSSSVGAIIIHIFVSRPEASDVGNSALESDLPDQAFKAPASAYESILELKPIDSRSQGSTGLNICEVHDDIRAEFALWLLKDVGASTSDATDDEAVTDKKRRSVQVITHCDPISEFSLPQRAHVFPAPLSFLAVVEQFRLELELLPLSMNAPTTDGEALLRELLDKHMKTAELIAHVPKQRFNKILCILSGWRHVEQVRPGLIEALLDACRVFPTVSSIEMKSSTSSPYGGWVFNGNLLPGQGNRRLVAINYPVRKQDKVASPWSPGFVTKKWIKLDAVDLALFDYVDGRGWHRTLRERPSAGMLAFYSKPPIWWRKDPMIWEPEKTHGCSICSPWAEDY